MGLDDFAPAGDSANDPNEDLFDFDAHGDDAQEEVPAPTPAPAPAPSVEPEPGAEVEAPEEALDDVLDSLDAALPAELPLEEQEDEDEVSSVPDMNVDLDEDLFGFPPIDLSGMGTAHSLPGAAPAGGADDRGAQLVTDMLEDDLGEMFSDDDENGEDETGEEPEVPTAPTPPRAEEPAESAPEPEDTPPAATAALPAHAVAAPNQRMLWALTAAVIVFLAGLLGIAWRATSSFQTQIDNVRSDVRATAEELQETSSERSAQLARLEAELLRARIAAANGDDESDSSQRLGGMEAAHDRDLAVAQQLFDGAHFSEGRRVLFTLLAQADRVPADHRPRVEEEARFLIATSYVSEAEALTGEPE